MARFEKKTNYRSRYPGLSVEIIEFLQQNDRKIKYYQYDLKIEQYKIDYVKGTVTYLPSREDSYDRLMEENRQFASEAEYVEDIAVKDLMIEKMLGCLKLLDVEDEELIMELFFKDKSEHQLARQTGIPRMTIHNRKKRVLAQLKKLLDK